MKYSKGQWVAILDGDLQDPPEVVFEMLDKAKEGYDVVYGVRKSRKEGFIKRALGQFVEPEQSAQDEMRYLRNQYRRSRQPSLSLKHREEISKTSREFRKRILKRKLKHHARS